MIPIKKTKPVVFTILLIYLFLWGCENSMKNLIQQNEPFYKDVTTQEASTLITDNKGNENFILLDVRTPQEYASGHLEYAINIDYNSSTFKQSLTTFDKDKTYLLYCRTGNRSSNAFKIMKEMGFKKVYHMVGGIEAWTSEELPTVK